MDIPLAPTYDAPMTALLYTLLIACKAPEDSQGRLKVPHADSGTTDSPTDSVDSSTTDSHIPIDTGTIDYDCSVEPPGVLGDTTMDESRAYHGLSFDQAGHLVGWDGRSSLIKNSYDGTREILLPGMRNVEQIDRLPDGNFVVVDAANGRLLRVTPDGGSETLASDTVGTYGVTVGPDGMVYIAGGAVQRVNPETGEVAQYLRLPRGETAHAINFNLDSTRMYIGTIGRGLVYSVDLDADLNPVGEPQIFASNVGTGWHDGVGVDVCGNVYVAEYWSSGLYRISPDGVVTALINNTNTAIYGHGLQWGNGLGGWRADALYQPQPYNSATVREVVIGLPSGDRVRTWNGQAAPW